MRVARLSGHAAAAVSAALSLLLGGCGRSTPSPVAATQAPYPAATVRNEAVPLEQRFDGAVEAVNQATIAAQTAGTVTAVYFDANDSVAAGALLLRLRGTEQRSGLEQAQAAVAEAAARAAEARTRHARIADMQARKVVPRAMLDEATANLASAEARLKAARAGVASARQGVGYTEVRAPYAGILAQRHVQIGETVMPGAPLFTMLSTAALRVGVDIPQRLVESLRSGSKAAVYVGERRIEAAKFTLYAAANGAATSVHARLELPAGTSGVYPGQYVKVGVQTGVAERLVVPVGALVERGEMTGVYVVGDTGGARLRQLRLGQRFGDRIEVLAGLQAGERIALDPNQALAAMHNAAPASP